MSSSPTINENISRTHFHSSSTITTSLSTFPSTLKTYSAMLTTDTVFTSESKPSSQNQTLNSQGIVPSIAVDPDSNNLGYSHTMNIINSSTSSLASADITKINIEEAHPIENTTTPKIINNKAEKNNTLLNKTTEISEPYLMYSDLPQLHEKENQEKATLAVHEQVQFLPRKHFRFHSSSSSYMHCTDQDENEGDRIHILDQLTQNSTQDRNEALLRSESEETFSCQFNSLNFQHRTSNVGNSDHSRDAMSVRRRSTINTPSSFRNKSSSSSRLIYYKNYKRLPRKRKNSFDLRHLTDTLDKLLDEEEQRERARQQKKQVIQGDTETFLKDRNVSYVHISERAESQVNKEEADIENSLVGKLNDHRKSDGQNHNAEIEKVNLKDNLSVEACETVDTKKDSHVLIRQMKGVMDQSVGVPIVKDFNDYTATADRSTFSSITIKQKHHLLENDKEQDELNTKIHTQHDVRQEQSETQLGIVKSADINLNNAIASEIDHPSTSNGAVPSLSASLFQTPVKGLPENEIYHETMGKTSHDQCSSGILGIHNSEYCSEVPKFSLPPTPPQKLDENDVNEIFNSNIYSDPNIEGSLETPSTFLNIYKLINNDTLSVEEKIEDLKAVEWFEDIYHNTVSDFSELEHPVSHCSRQSSLSEEKTLNQIAQKEDKNSVQFSSRESENDHTLKLKKSHTDSIQSLPSTNNLTEECVDHIPLVDRNALEDPKTFLDNSNNEAKVMKLLGTSSEADLHYDKRYIRNEEDRARRSFSLPDFAQSKKVMKDIRKSNMNTVRGQSLFTGPNVQELSKQGFLYCGELIYVRSTKFLFKMNKNRFCILGCDHNLYIYAKNDPFETPLERIPITHNSFVAKVMPKDKWMISVTSYVKERNKKTFSFLSKSKDVDEFTFVEKEWVFHCDDEHATRAWIRMLRKAVPSPLKTNSRRWSQLSNPLLMKPNTLARKFGMDAVESEFSVPSNSSFSSPRQSISIYSPHSSPISQTLATASSHFHSPSMYPQRRGSLLKRTFSNSSVYSNPYLHQQQQQNHHHVYKNRPVSSHSFTDVAMLTNVSSYQSLSLNRPPTLQKQQNVHHHSISPILPHVFVSSPLQNNYHHPMQGMEHSSSMMRMPLRRYHSLTRPSFY